MSKAHHLFSSIFISFSLFAVNIQPVVAAISTTPLPTRTAVAVFEAPEPTSGKLKFTVVKFDTTKTTPYVSTGIPFAPGQLKDPKNVVIYNTLNQELQVATKVLAYWPQDNSIRSLLVQFYYPMSTTTSSYIYMAWGKARTKTDRALITPSGTFPQGMIKLTNSWLCHSKVVDYQTSTSQTIYSSYDQTFSTAYNNLSIKPLTGDLVTDYFYDTPHTYYQWYVRSGDIKYFKSARKSLIDYRDNHIIQSGTSRGRAIQNANTRYMYMEAMADDYLLTGDTKSLTIASYMAEYFKNNVPPTKGYYPKTASYFWTEREQAFPFLGFIIYYELTGDSTYKTLADQYMDNLYKTQLEWPARGGFIHNLYAHDPEEGCLITEYGGSPFMTGLLMEAIIKYHILTKSAKAADSIFRVVDWLINEALAPSGDSFRYLTCSAYQDGAPDLNLLTVQIFGYAYKLSGYLDSRYLNWGQKILKTGVDNAYLGDKKHMNQNFRSSAHYLKYLYDSPAF
jgi:hypothetical protein